MGRTNPPPLSAAQREIMEIVWERGEVTVSQVREAVARRRKLARNTVQTMLVRLEAKGWLKHRVSGRSFVYFANLPRKATLGKTVGQMVDRFFAGSPEEMVTALLEYRGLSKEEANRIRAMIDESEAFSKSKKRGE